MRNLHMRHFANVTMMLVLLMPTFLLAPVEATVSTTTPRNDYIGNGATATYSYTFRIFAATDLRVTTRNTAGVETTLTYPTDYSVTGVNGASGGTITLTAGNLTTDYALTIRFDRTPRQSTDLRNQGSFFAETHEDKFDELTRYVQQHEDVIDRSLHLPETEAGSAAATTLPAAGQRASKFLGFDGSGNLIAAAGTSADLGPVSSFINTLLDDANAAAARTTLDVPSNAEAVLDTLIDAKGDLLTGSAADTPARLAAGSNDQILIADSAQATGLKWGAASSVVPAASESTAGIVELATQAEVDAMTDTARSLTPNHNKIVLGTPVASTSGTSIDFTGIPSGVRRITIMFSGVSTNGGSDLLMQIGDSGGVETSGYLGAGFESAGATTSNFTTGFGLRFNANAAAVIHGLIHLHLADSSTNTWVSGHTLSQSDNNRTSSGSGSKSLSAVLDRVRITTVNGTDAFDAGQINISYDR